MTIQALTENLLNLVYPAHCYICKTRLGALDKPGLCERCKSGIRQVHICHTKGTYSACIYEGPIKEVIHLFKYNGKVALGRFLSGLMIDFAKSNPEALDGIDIIAFVPMLAADLRRRGYNQSRILAFAISKHYGIKLGDLLEKTVSTRHQNELTRDERLSNLKGAFRPKNLHEVDGARILLVDDVMTTGATLDECAKTLIRSGAKEVRSFTLARGL